MNFQKKLVNKVRAPLKKSKNGKTFYVITFENREICFFRFVTSVELRKKNCESP